MRVHLGFSSLFLISRHDPVALAQSDLRVASCSTKSTREDRSLLPPTTMRLSLSTSLALLFSFTPVIRCSLAPFCEWICTSRSKQDPLGAHKCSMHTWNIIAGPRTPNTTAAGLVKKWELHHDSRRIQFHGAASRDGALFLTAGKETGLVRHLPNGIASPDPALQDDTNYAVGLKVLDRSIHWYWIRGSSQCESLHRVFDGFDSLVNVRVVQEP
jgi:hypothetical protein